MIIAIDGPAAAGKGTLTRRLADHFGLALLDTGLLYRAVGLATARAGADATDVAAAAAAANTLDPADLDDPTLRGDEAAQLASKVAVIPEVRAALLEFQRAFAHNPPGDAKGAVLDGRDIGTQVCPDADVKLFLTASVEVRAERRVKELRGRGLEAIHARVLRDMKERDARDSGRDVAPLEPADDAFVLDTSDLDADAVFARALEFISAKDESGQA
jgi:cytidylate kinase